MFKSANVGNLDRALRLLVGIALMAAAFISASPYLSSPLMKWGAAAIGLVLVLTALFRFCPLYRLVGANTCKVS